MMSRGPSFVVLILVAFVLALWGASYSTHGPRALTSSRSVSGADNILDTQNATLGFQKIFVINMPSRTDKRDALTLAAYYTGIELEFVDAVLGADVPLKAYPQDWPPKEAINSIGTWRAHMNVYQRMIQQKIQTALIMEDDADWDVMLKSQLIPIATGARHIQQSLHQTHSPYGDSWDVFFLGHCGTNNRVDGHFLPIDSRYWVLPSDPTVVPPKHAMGVRSPNRSPPPISGVANGDRILFSPYKVTCLQAYGVSLAGATRILHDQALRPHSSVIDIAWSQMCKFRRLRNPLAVHPPIIGQHRPPGDGSGDSDRTLHHVSGGGVRKVGYTENVNFPMRLNLQAFVEREFRGDGGGVGTGAGAAAGRKEEMKIKSQYPGETMYDFIEPEGLELPMGKPVIVLKEDFVIPPPGSENKAASGGQRDWAKGPGGKS